MQMIETTINGRWELLLPLHRAARPEWKTGWEVKRLDSMHKNIKPGDTVIDVGVEEGDISALIAQWTGPTGKMFMVEPNKKVVPNTKAIFEANNITTPQRWFVGFAGSKTNDIPRHPMKDGWPECAYGPVIGNHGFKNISEEGDTLPMTTLDDWMQEDGKRISVDVVTMDVEGGEFEVLKGMNTILQVFKPLVWTSIHREFLFHQYGQYANELKRYMTDRGYVPHFLEWNHEEHFLWAHPDGRKPIF